MEVTGWTACRREKSGAGPGIPDCLVPAAVKLPRVLHEGRVPALGAGAVHAGQIDRLCGGEAGAERAEDIGFAVEAVPGMRRPAGVFRDAGGLQDGFPGAEKSDQIIVEAAAGVAAGEDGPAVDPLPGPVASGEFRQGPGTGEMRDAGAVDGQSGGFQGSAVGAVKALGRDDQGAVFVRALMEVFSSDWQSGSMASPELRNDVLRVPKPAGNHLQAVFQQSCGGHCLFPTTEKLIGPAIQIEIPSRCFFYFEGTLEQGLPRGGAGLNGRDDRSGIRVEGFGFEQVLFPRGRRHRQPCGFQGLVP